MDFEELENRVHDEIIFADDIATETSALLNGLTDGDVVLVHRLAKNIDDAIAREIARKEIDMVSVIQTLGAVLEPATNWLQSRGVRPRSLRSTTRIGVSVN
jgi:hypothetical protein